MKNSNVKVCAVMQDAQWYFVDDRNNRVKFDQAIFDATFVSPEKFEGFVVSVHGVEQQIADFLDSKTRHNLGIKAVHSLGNGPTLRRVRLMEGGAMERVA